MVIKLLFFTLIVYLIYRAVANMLRAIRNDVREGMRPTMPRQEQRSPPIWQARDQARVPAAKADIEDAKWTDLPS